MGKKKVIKKSEEEILKETAKSESAISKVSKGDSSLKTVKIDNIKIYINATYNNTIMAAADKNGNILAWSSAGALGFSGPKKATPFAASKVSAAITEKLKKIGSVNVDVVIKGVGSGRDSAVRSLAGHGFNILSIKDVTPIPHNGPKPPKVRRV